MTKVAKRSAVRGKAVRITKLDGCGTPVYGPESTVVSRGFITATITPNTEETEEISQTNANGDICVREPAKTRISNLGLSIELCAVDPALAHLMTGAPMVYDETGTVVGFRMDTAVNLDESGFGFELWTGSPGEGCGTGGAQQLGYFLLPYLQSGTVGEITVENGAATFTIENAVTREGGMWGVGPYNVINLSGTPSPLAEPMTGTQPFHQQWTTFGAPEESDGIVPLLDPSETAPTSITATPDALDVEFTVAPASSAPVVYNFGDGTEEVYAVGGEASHTYAAAGTYTVTARRGSGTATTEVTVTP